MTTDDPHANDIEAVKLVYGIAIGDIREFKARQWDLTKWTILVVLAMIVPNFLKQDAPKEARELTDLLFWIGWAISLGSITIILRLQWSLRDCRRNLERYKGEWPALKCLYGQPKWNHMSFWSDYYVWGFQIALILAALAILALVTGKL